MGIGKPRDVAATNGHIACSSVLSRVGGCATKHEAFMWLVVGLPFDSATRRCWDATNSQYAWGLIVERGTGGYPHLVLQSPAVLV
jgi:hypothetical protein